LSNNSLKVIADHIRATSFLISDGVLPSNEGRGYVQRRIVRRAIRHGYKLGQKTPFFHKLVPDLVRVMGQAYPSLQKNEQKIIQTLKQEEERFYETLEVGMEILEQALSDGTKVLPGELAFKLHDTYGFPLDLSADVCREKGIDIDEHGFHQAMDRQKTQARMAGKFKMDKSLDYQGPSCSFVGYGELHSSAKVLALFVDSQPVQHISENQQATIVLDVTPFYAESGGQVGDQGVLISSGAHFDVTDTQKIKSDVYAHLGVLTKGQLRVGDKVEAKVNSQVRVATARHHSATHLMHLALRTVLGDHVQQKGSLVSAERTRFDFAHNAPLTHEQIKSIESQVNHAILTNTDTQSKEMDLESAKKTGAMMLFGEKYAEMVRVLSIGESRELCGGTHVQATGDIGLFKILSESGVAAGVRRIEAVCGEMALDYVEDLQNGLTQVAHLLKSSPEEVGAKVKQTLEHQKALEKEIAQLKSQLAASQSDELLSNAIDRQGIKILVQELQGLDTKALKDTVDLLKDKLKTCIVLLASVQDGKVQLVCGVSKDLISKVKAGEVVNFVAQQVGGKGGGKPDMAMAGGTQPENLKKALDSSVPWLEKLL
jgi:alanyl-tRNA synthetase